MRRCASHEAELRERAFPNRIRARAGNATCERRDAAPEAADVARGGFTLFEMLLVLTVLVVIASITWPAVTRYLRDQEILEGAEAARGAAAASRIKAIDTGLTYQFRYEPQGRRFVVIPFDPPESIAASSTATEPGSGVSTYPVLSGRLGEHSRFVIPEDQPPVAEGLPRESFANLPDAGDLETSAWGPPILFYPDGTAADATFRIVNDDQLRVDLSVRGLTGTLSVSPLMQEGGP